MSGNQHANNYTFTVPTVNSASIKRAVYITVESCSGPVLNLFRGGHDNRGEYVLHSNSWSNSTYTNENALARIERDQFAARVYRFTYSQGRVSGVRYDQWDDTIFDRRLDSGTYTIEVRDSLWAKPGSFRLHVRTSGSLPSPDSNYCSNIRTGLYPSPVHADGPRPTPPTRAVPYWLDQNGQQYKAEGQHKLHGESGPGGPPEVVENSPPVFDEGASATRTVAENSAGGVNVGLPVTASDPDDDELVYSVDPSTDFDIDSSTGQLTTKDGVSYDFETKPSYDLLVLADEVGTDQEYQAYIRVTVNLTDVEETTQQQDDTPSGGPGGEVEEPDTDSGNEDPPSQPPEPDPSPPTANAGADFNAKRGETVSLSGSGTANAAGSQSLSYQWTVSAASVGELATVAAGSEFLTGTDKAVASFTVPRRKNMNDRSALDNGNTITFTLTVTDGDGESHSDTVTLTIQGTTWKAG